MSGNAAEHKFSLVAEATSCLATERPLCSFPHKIFLRSPLLHARTQRLNLQIYWKFFLPLSRQTLANIGRTVRRGKTGRFYNIDRLLPFLFTREKRMDQSEARLQFNTDSFLLASE